MKNDSMAALGKNRSSKMRLQNRIVPSQGGFLTSDNSVVCVDVVERRTSNIIEYSVIVDSKNRFFLKIKAIIFTKIDSGFPK